MPWIIAGGVAAGGAISGFLGGQASKSAAQTAADAANQASKTQLQMFNTTQGNLQPYMQQGTQSLGQLGQQFGSANSPGNQPFGAQQFQASPAYQWNLQQGQQAIDKQANASGNLYAPQTLQDVAQYSQGVASNEFQNAFSNYNQTQNQIFSRLSGIAGSGQNAAANLGGFSGQVGGQIGANTQNAGNYQAAGILGQNSAMQGAFGQAGNAALQAYMLQQQQGLYGSVGPYNQAGLDSIGATSPQTGFIPN